MSIPFNDTTNFRGIVQQYEKEIGANQGQISGDTQKLKEFTADVNLAFDDFLNIAIPASGTYQYDDSNHTDYPFIKTNIVSGQRDYPFLQDENGNGILDIYKVAILTSATGTQYQELTPVDTQSEPNLAATFNSSVTGIPGAYDKTGNGIVFDVIPSYSATLGLLLYINREASYFTSTDTTKKPGVPGIFHRWFAIRPAEDYARRNNLTNYPLLRAERLQMEKDIAAYFGRRERDVRHIIKPKGISFR
jgi:hypothetical protein